MRHITTPIIAPTISVKRTTLEIKKIESSQVFSFIKRKEVNKKRLMSVIT